MIAWRLACNHNTPRRRLVACTYMLMPSLHTFPHKTWAFKGYWPTIAHYKRSVLIHLCLNCYWQSIIALKQAPNLLHLSNTATQILPYWWAHKNLTNQTRQIQEMIRFISFWWILLQKKQNNWKWFDPKSDCSIQENMNDDEEVSDDSDLLQFALVTDMPNLVRWFIANSS